MNTKGKVLFVDDEKRVLNSMRGLFRREYELFLTTDGAEAVRLVAEHDIDVIVADQRMPGLTGVQVLGKVRESSPRTVRILLTGYADPEAIEGSINVGEVFRFLSKPCQPKLLRETLKLGVDASRVATTAVTKAVRQTVSPAPAATQSVTPESTIDVPAATPAATPEQRASDNVWPTSEEQQPAVTEAAQTSTQELADQALEPGPAETVDASPIPLHVPAPNEETEAATLPLTGADTHSNVRPLRPAANDADQSGSHWQKHTEIVLSGDSSQEVAQLQLTSEANTNISKVGVAVFTVNPTFAESAMRAISADRSAMLVTTLVKVAEVLEQREAGVLVTDFTSDISLLQNMIGTLKHHLPELVTIVVSENRDATDMINLINYGQVFRYVEKPIDAQMLRTDVAAAVLKHLQLVEHPELVQRHQVIDFSAPKGSSPTLNQFIGKVTRLRGRWTNTYDSSH